MTDSLNGRVPVFDADRLASMLDETHSLLHDDPGDGSGPAFCECGHWDESLPLSWGAHVATEYQLSIHESEARR